MPTTAPKTITTDADPTDRQINVTQCVTLKNLTPDDVAADADLTDAQIVTPRVTLIADAADADPIDNPTARPPFTEAERADRYRARLVFLYWDAVDAYLQQQRKAGRVPTKRGAVRAAQAAKRAAAKRGRS